MIINKKNEFMKQREIGNWEYDVGTKKTTWLNETFVLSEHDITAGPPAIHNKSKYYSPEQAKELQDYKDEVAKTGKEYKYELKAKLLNGEPAYFYTTILPVKDESGKVVKLFGIVKDITELKILQLKLENSLKQWKTTFDSVSDAICLLDNKRNILQCNKAFSNLVQKPFKDLISHNCCKTIHGSSGLFENCPFTKMNQIHSRETTDIQVNNKWFTIAVSPIFDEKNNITGAVHTISDITERKKTEEYIKKQERNLEIVINSTSDIIFLKDKDLKYLVANKSLEKFFNVKTEDIIGKTDFSFMPKELAEKCKEGDMKALENNEASKTDEKIGDNYFETVKQRIEDSNGNVTGVAGIIHDITGRIKNEETIRKSLELTQKTMKEIIHAIALTVESRDPYTAGHQLRVSNLAEAIGKELEMPEQQIEQLYLASTIHDIGKISVPSEILSKPGKLTKQEFELIKYHPIAGYNILKEIVLPWPLAEITLQHHERLNGSGYPKGLVDIDILLEAKIIAVADVIEAMASHRPYRASLGIEKALFEINEYKGILYDKKVVDACTILFKEKGFRFN